MDAPAALNLPALHDKHSPLPAYLPATHCVHPPAPAGETDPAAHELHALLPVPLAYVLMLQVAHVACLTEPATDPSAQLLQTEYPALSAYFPIEQDVHDAAPAALYVPAPHDTHDACPAEP